MLCVVLPRDGQLSLDGKPECFGSGGSLVAKLKLKGIDGKAPPGVELAAQFDSTRETSPDPSVFGDGQWHTQHHTVSCVGLEATS